MTGLCLGHATLLTIQVKGRHLKNGFVGLHGPFGSKMSLCQHLLAQ